MPASFTLTHPGAVTFGEGSLATLPDAVRALGDRAFVVTDAGIRASGILGDVRTLLSDAAIEHDVFDGVEPNPGVATVDAGAAAAGRFGQAVVVAIGGGSSLDAAKGIALAATNAAPAGAQNFSASSLSPGLPVIAIPTTAGTGAETNGFAVIDDPVARCKVYLGDASVTPRMSILDPMLTVGLPPAATAATGIDALVHAVESLTSRGRNAVSEAFATEAARRIATWLRTAVDDGGDREARGQMLLGSHLAGLALSGSGLGLVHGIAHALTAHTGAPHGIALAAVLERVLEFNLPAATPEYARLAFALGAGDTGDGDGDNARSAVRACAALATDVGTVKPLRDLHCTRAMVPSLVRTALADPVTRNTPRMPSDTELAELLLAAL